MEFKTSDLELKKLNDKGEGEAIFATLNVIDSDADVTFPGAFGEQMVQMTAAHRHQDTPIGKTTIKENGNSVLADFKLNLNNSLGRDWYAALKFDMDNPPSRQQWSYGYTVLDSDMGDFEGKQVRFLKKLLVHEVSPVLIGAGVGTGTLDLKGKTEEKKNFKLEDEIIVVRDSIKSLFERVREIQGIRANEGRWLSRERFKELLELKTLLIELDTLLEFPDHNSSKIFTEYHELQKKLLDFRKLIL